MINITVCTKFGAKTFDRIESLKTKKDVVYGEFCSSI